MNWIDQLQEHGTKQKREARKRRVKPLVQEVLVMVRRPSDNDPGEVTTGYYVIEDNTLQMTDQNGMPLKDSARVTLDPESNVKSIASSLTRKRWDETRGCFWRRLSYEPSSIA
jgi:hypothetical protein